MTGSFQGQRAIVTAGAGGAGRVISTKLAAEGAEVFVCDVNEAVLSDLPAGLTGEKVDVSDPEAVERWLAPIVAGGVDILINNAGIAGPTANVEDIAIEGWKQCLAVDLDSQFYCTRLVVPAMKAQKRGCIVNISSTAGQMGLPGRSPYTAAKFAIVGLTKTWAMELGPDNIRVNAIAPGSIEGDRMERVIAAHAAQEGISKERVRAMYTLGTSMATFVEAEEIAEMILYLCSDKAKRISGQIIAVDGHTETLYPRDLG